MQTNEITNMHISALAHLMPLGNSSLLLRCIYYAEGLHFSTFNFCSNINCGKEKEFCKVINYFRRIKVSYYSTHTEKVQSAHTQKRLLGCAEIRHYN